MAAVSVSQEFQRDKTSSYVISVCVFDLLLWNVCSHPETLLGFPFQIALASFYEDGGDEDILTLPQPTPSSVSRGTAAR